jgi:hypothetical protein
MESFAKVFSLEEAEALLDTLRPVVARMVEARDRILNLRPSLEPLMEKAGGNGGSRKASEILEALEEIRRAIEAIQAHGVQVKDVNTGLIDFPSPREGRLVFLCWRNGEDHIRFWHELDAGVSGRQPL